MGSKVLKKILVTGGAGFIGSHLCDRLLADGAAVWALDNFVTGRRENLRKALAHEAFTLIEADVQDPLPEIDFDEIYNLACPASPPQYQKDAVATMRTNVLGAINTLERARACGARVLQASTSEVYGDPEFSPQHEDYFGYVNCVGRRACYDEGKRAAETLFYDYQRQYEVEVRIGRIFNTYGPRMDVKDGRVAPNFIAQALAGEPLTVYGDGGQTRSFCYVDDMVEALIGLMAADGGRVGPINLGNPEEITIADFAEKVIALAGGKAGIEHRPLPEDDPKIRRPNIDKAAALLEWRPTTPLDEGLEKTVAWYAEKLGVQSATTPPAEIASEPAAAQAEAHLDAPSLGRPVLVTEDGEAAPQAANNPFRPLIKSAPPTPPVTASDGRGPGSVGVIGGGPAGLTAAYVLQKDSLAAGAPAVPVTVFEGSDLVGGIARTESYKGYRFDIGGHRFFTKVSEVEDLWKEVGGDDFVKRPRMSRIYYRDKYYAYPLKIFNALMNMGPIEAARIMMSYAKWQLFPHREEENFEQWVTNRFGGRLYNHFFKSYTEKVWGIPCTEIRADWAAQRIKNLSLTKAVWNALTGSNDTASLIEEFDYPRLGPGQMWERFQERIEDQGGDVRMKSYVRSVKRQGSKVTSIEVVEEKDGKQRAYDFSADHFISSMPMKTLVNVFDPPPPPKVRRAAEKLKYRDFLIVTLVLDHPDPFPDNWIYVHSPEVNVGRIQNFRSWSEDMVPRPDRASIGMEYFCHQGDGLWETSDEELIALASKELAHLRLASESTVVDGAVIRQPKAYPVYDGEYREAVDTIMEWILTLDNFQTVGRNGMHRYNNQDHSMLTAMLAAKNILGERHDIWNVNVERSYHEEFQVSDRNRATKAA